MTDVVVPGPWPGTGSTLVLRVRWFVASYAISRHLMEDRASWTEGRLVVEHKMRLTISEHMRAVGYVPIGEAEIQQVEDVAEWTTTWRMRQRAMESDSPVWISIREAFAEDQEWLRERRVDT